MFCPKCGSANQQQNSYCRSCGLFLPDFEKLKKQETTPEQHLKVNLVLNFLSAIVSLTLAILLYSYFLGRENTPLIIYVTGGFLIAIFGWQVQLIIRTFLLKKHFRKHRNLTPAAETSAFENFKTSELLGEADQSLIITPTSAENTTKKLDKTSSR